MIYSFLLLQKECYTNVINYLNHLVDVKDHVRDAIRAVLKYFDSYENGINSSRNILELRPSLAQRDAYNHHFVRLMSEEMKKAEKSSVMLSLVSKSIILYGKKSISYVNNPNGESTRMEIPLHSHSTQMEIPRFLIIDPYNIDFTIRVFRTEQRK